MTVRWLKRNRLYDSMRLLEQQVRTIVWEQLFSQVDVFGPSAAAITHQTEFVPCITIPHQFKLCCRSLDAHLPLGHFCERLEILILSVADDLATYYAPHRVNLCACEPVGRHPDFSKAQHGWSEP